MQKRDPPDEFLDPHGESGKALAACRARPIRHAPADAARGGAPQSVAHPRRKADTLDPTADQLDDHVGVLEGLHLGDVVEADRRLALHIPQRDSRHAVHRHQGTKVKGASVHPHRLDPWLGGAPEGRHEVRRLVSGRAPVFDERLHRLGRRRSRAAKEEHEGCPASPPKRCQGLHRNGSGLHAPKFSRYFPRAGIAFARPASHSFASATMRPSSSIVMRPMRTLVLRKTKYVSRVSCRQ